ncbi:glycosyltransferase family 4 protein [Flavobacterium hydrocarbonoxydans]|nr:glycosyltransferase family 4 protein [Flavobacterium hydrocarbonoxydans]
MKIVHISGARSWGGNEQQLIDMIPELAKIGVDNVVFGVKKSPLEKECILKGINFIEALGDKLNTFSNYKYLKEIVKLNQPDLIHLHTSDSLTVFTISDLLYNLKVKAVFSKKGMGNSSSVLSKFKYNYKNVAKIICVSEAVKKSFSAIIFPKNISKLEVVYDGINLERTKTVRLENIKELFNISDNKIVVGNIANHVPAKDLPTLIKAINYLVNDIGLKNVHLVQIGEFSNKVTPVIREMITEFKLEEYITIAGFQSNALDFLTQFDIYVMSSQREGLPLTIYEAFLKKVPVVSTKAGGIPEAINHDFNGFLSEIFDYRDLALNLKKISEDENKRIKFVERSYSLFFEKFTAQENAKNISKIYSKESLKGLN